MANRFSPLTLLRILLRGLHLLLLMLIGALISLWLPLQPRGRPLELEQRRIRAKRWWLRRLCRCLRVSIRVDGRPPEQAGLLIANHISWLDIPVLGSLADCQFLAKAEVAHWPLIGWLCRQAGTRFINRGQGQSAVVKSELAQLIEEQVSVLIFPEGTTSDGQSVKHFHHRLLGAAGEQPVYPVVLSYWHEGQPCRQAPYIDRDIFFFHLLRLLAKPHTRVHISFLPPLAARQPREQARQAAGLIKLGLKRHQHAALLSLKGDEQVRSFYTG